MRPIPRLLPTLGLRGIVFCSLSCSDAQLVEVEDVSGLPTPGSVLLIGVDGMEWSVARPLVETGRMPHLAALMARGAHGPLETRRPTWSPVLWASIATGRAPAEHGIEGFVYEGEDGPHLYDTPTDAAGRGRAPALRR